MIECPKCHGEKIAEPMISNCCGANMDDEQKLCLQCGEHCEPAECDECDGKGEVPSRAERIADAKADDWRRD